MKNAFLRIAVLLFAMMPVGHVIAQHQKGQVLFNDGWQFHKGDIAGAQTNAVQWNAVQLPHDWSIEGPFSEEWASATAYLPGGIGWYKKTFVAPATWHGKKVYINFDGVYKNSEVWLNGHLLGKRPNGFISFTYDLSPCLKYGEKNLLTVKVDHSEFADSRWYTGSGIYRDVNLLVKEPVHIQQDGIAFSTPQVSAQNVKLQVNATITNSTTVASSVIFKVDLIDAKGSVAAAKTQRISLKPGENIVSTAALLSSPELWSVDEPNLYQLKTTVLSGAKVIDEQTQLVGVRSIRFDKNEGFFLNGVNMKMKGVCIHDDAGALGVAVPQAVWERRLRILKEAGVNALRLSHNPHASYLYNLCDKMGFLVMDEAFDEWEIGKNKWVKGWNVGTPSKDGYHEHFKEWAERDLADMVKHDRNHPSIIMWSIGNEIDYPNDPYSHPVLNSGRNPQIYGKGYLPDHPAASGLTVIAKKLVSAVKAVDTTRPVTAALAGVVMSNEVGYPETLDVVGYNYQEYRYAEDHQKYPNRVIYGSENGMAQSAWQAVDTNKYIAGQFLWTGIDYLGEAGKWPQRSNGAGLIDLAGFKKPEYYYRQSLWASKPMVFIGVRLINENQDRGIWSHRNVQPVWNWQSGQLRVECYTNCAETELFLNGHSLGKKLRDTSAGKVPAWIVAYEPGELTVKGYNNGRQLCSYSLKTADEAAKIEALADRTVFTRKEKELCQVELQVTDKNGNPVYTAENDIEVQVTGNARLLGLESGSTISHEDYRADHRKALHGKLIAYIQTESKPGDINLKFNARGLTSSTINLKVK